MKALVFAAIPIAFSLIQDPAVPRAPGCDPAGTVQFICGFIDPEDLVIAPGSEWMIASGSAPKAITLVNVRDKTTTTLYPSENVKDRLDSRTYASCPGPLDAEEKGRFRARGLFLRPSRSSVHTLYVVHHGKRESVEVFAFDARPRLPELTWIGCAVAPDRVGLNSVVALPDGGFAATNFQARDDARGLASVLAGETSGELWEWHPGTGWKIVPGSEASGANGIEISRDGESYYMAAWGSQTLIRLSRRRAPVERFEVPVDFRVDNLRWSPDGSLLAAGQEIPATGKVLAATSHVIKIDPSTLKVQELIRYPYIDAFNLATTAIYVGREIWAGSVRGDRIARFLPR
jgi:hypothetical protein